MKFKTAQAELERQQQALQEAQRAKNVKQLGLTAIPAQAKSDEERHRYDAASKSGGGASRSVDKAVKSAMTASGITSLALDGAQPGQAVACRRW